MKIYKSNIRFGFTLIELMVTMLIALLVFAGIGAAMVDSIKAFPKMYERTEGTLIGDAYSARYAFDRVCRKASRMVASPALKDSDQSVEVYYYDPDTSGTPNKYAWIKRENSSLVIESGDYDSASGTKSGTPSNEIVATTVDANNPPLFDVQGSSVVMVLKLKQGNQTMMVVSSAVRHSE